RELHGHVAELDLGPRRELRALHARAVHVHPVQAARVLDVEASPLVLDAGVVLGDGRLVHREVVVAGPAQGVGPRAEEADLAGELAAPDLQDRHGHAVPAVDAAGGVERVLLAALRAQHRTADDYRSRAGASTRR